MNCCGNCKSFKLAQGDLGECRFNPPSVALVAMAPDMFSSEQQNKPVSFWPPVRAEFWCRKHEGHGPP